MWTPLTQESARFTYSSKFTSEVRDLVAFAGACYSIARMVAFYGEVSPKLDQPASFS